MIECEHCGNPQSLCKCCLRCGDMVTDYADVCNSCHKQAKQAGCSWEELPAVDNDQNSGDD